MCADWQIKFDPFLQQKYNEQIVTCLAKKYNIDIDTWGKAREKKFVFLGILFLIGTCEVAMTICSHFSCVFFFMGVEGETKKIKWMKKNNRAQSNANKLLTDVRVILYIFILYAFIYTDLHFHLLCNFKYTCTCTLYTVKKKKMYTCLDAHTLGFATRFRFGIFGFGIFLHLDFPCATTHTSTST